MSQLSLIPMRRRGSLALLIATAVAASLAATATAAPKTVKAIGPVKGCVFMTLDDAISTAQVKIEAIGANKTKGTLKVSGSGHNSTVPFVMYKGVAIVGIPVDRTGTLVLLATLNTKPVKARRFTAHIKVNNELTQSNCIPK